ncbi:MAG TPA: transferase hexapeptide repeat family protein [Streptosporangiaceae bacterium]|nr:transferase hexapeptide repeat family protein [Streptosporangiaceae bacterium]
MGGCYSIDGVVPVVHPTAFVHPDAVLIGDVRIGPGCYIGPLASLRGDLGTISIGAGANIQDSCVLHCFPGRELVVEDDGHIGHAVVLHGCRVGRGALVGINAVLMDGAVVGTRSFIGACSFVPADMAIPDGWLAVGSPARIVRALTEQEMSWKANGTAVYQELAARSAATLSAVTPLTELDAGRPALAVDAARAVPLRQYRQQRG